jgi:NAD(P)-dependent dehydrogenase (short-subunit alcohol dehydrogenase family)
MTLAGRHAFVTGAGRGIGRGIALALAGAGAAVTLAARSREELESAAAEIEAAGGSASVEVLDTTDEQACEAAFARAEQRAPLSILVTAAGTNRPAPTHLTDFRDWKLILETNVDGTFLACRAFGRILLAARREGAVVTVSSQMGSVGYPGRAAYCASKHAVNGLTKALAVEWAPRGITVNAVAPTFVRTPLTEPMLADDAFRADVLRRIPAGRIGEVGDVTGAVLYLVSDAARLVTGHVLAVDGGWVAW